MGSRARAVLVATVVAATLAAVALPGREALGQAMGPYVSPAGGFTIMFPTAWEQRPIAGGGIIALSPQETMADLFRENVNVVFEPLPTPMTVQQYAAANLQNMAASLQQFRVVEQGQGPVGTRQAWWGVYSHTMGQPLQVLAFFIVANGYGYVITCTGTPAEFARWRPIFVQVANTFRI
jgi:hypothetical protein